MQIACGMDAAETIEGGSQSSSRIGSRREGTKRGIGKRDRAIRIQILYSMKCGREEVAVRMRTAH